MARRRERRARGAAARVALGAAAAAGVVILAPAEVRAADGAVSAEPAAIRGPRVVLTPAVRYALAPRTTSRSALALSVDVSPTPRIAIGVTGALFAPFRGEAPAEGRSSYSDVHSTGFVETKISVLPRPGGVFDLYAVGGLGLVVSRPVSRVDPGFRSFDYGASVAFVGGGGARVHVTPTLAVGIEVRGTVNAERQEAEEIAPTDIGRRDPGTWFGYSLVAMRIEPQVGLSLVLP